MDEGLMLTLTKREVLEIKHALLYDQECNHGTTGHNQLILIAKFASYLGIAINMIAETDDCSAGIELVLPPFVDVAG